MGWGSMRGSMRMRGVVQEKKEKKRKKEKGGENIMKKEMIVNK